jgi:hypothetical protein
MCFSAAGSFAAAGVLAAIGTTSLRKNKSTPLRMFAAIPLLFAAQQAAEGIVWLTMNRPDLAGLQGLAVMTFLGFALLVWPAWLPLSLLRMEGQPSRRRMLAGLCLAGCVVSTCATLLLVRWHPTAQVAGHSIRYLYAGGPPQLPPGLYLAAYAIPTVVPFFVSSASLARITGLALIASLIAAVIVERDALTSVWCFFAALLSGLVLIAVMHEQRLTSRGVPALSPAIN